MSLQPPPSIKRDSYRANTEHIPNTNLQSRRPEPIHINNQTFPIPPSSTISRLSATTAFNTGIDHRDGVSCVICNCEIRQCLEHAHIIERSRPDIWQWLKEEACCIPWNARGVEHECRNGILLCRNHHAAFDAHYLYIR